MEDREKILVRIKKMMALANDRAATEGERDNSLRMAHEILAKYNLTMAEADASGQTSEEKRTGGVMDTGGKKFPHVWQRTVANAIAHLYFCNYFFSMGKRQWVNHYVVGKQSNVYTAQEMIKYIILSIEREARHQKQYNGGDGAYERNFAKGAADVIRVRCNEIRAAAEVKPATSSCTALVLASVYNLEKKANDKYVLEVMGKRVVKSSAMHQRSSHREGYSEGRQYGGRVNLNTQLSGASSSKPRLN